MLMFLGQKQLEMSKNVQNWIFKTFLINPFPAELVWKSMIFDSIFATKWTIVYYNMAFVSRNFIFITERLQFIGFQKIRSDWLFVKHFYVILAIEVKKCAKSTTKNRAHTVLEHTPAPTGCQWGLVILFRFWPDMYPVQSCIASNFPC